MDINLNGFLLWQCNYTSFTLMEQAEEFNTWCTGLKFIQNGKVRPLFFPIAQLKLIYSAFFLKKEWQ